MKSNTTNNAPRGVVQQVNNSEVAAAALTALAMAGKGINYSTQSSTNTTGSVGITSTRQTTTAPTIANTATTLLVDRIHHPPPPTAAAAAAAGVRQDHTPTLFIQRPQYPQERLLSSSVPPLQPSPPPPQQQQQQQVRYVKGTDIGPYDCLLGRGTGPNENNGNRNFRALVNKYRDGYMNCFDRNSKDRYVYKVIHTIQKEQGGRFLKRIQKGSKKSNKAPTTPSTTPTSTTNTGGGAGGAGDAPPSCVAGDIYVVADLSTIFEKTRQAFMYMCRRRNSIGSQGSSNGENGGGEGVGGNNITTSSTSIGGAGAGASPTSSSSNNYHHHPIDAAAAAANAAATATNTSSDGSASTQTDKSGSQDLNKATTSGIGKTKTDFGEIFNSSRGASRLPSISPLIPPMSLATAPSSFAAAVAAAAAAMAANAAPLQAPPPPPVTPSVHYLDPMLVLSSLVNNSNVTGVAGSANLSSITPSASTVNTATYGSTGASSGTNSISGGSEIDTNAAGASLALQALLGMATRQATPTAAPSAEHILLSLLSMLHDQTNGNTTPSPPVNVSPSNTAGTNVNAAPPASRSTIQTVLLQVLADACKNSSLSVDQAANIMLLLTASSSDANPGTSPSS